MFTTLLSDNEGVPLSVAVKVIMKVPAWFELGLHEKLPVAGSKLAPVGNPGAERVSDSPGSGSDAVIAKLRKSPVLTILWPGTATTGGLFPLEDWRTLRAVECTVPPPVAVTVTE